MGDRNAFTSPSDPNWHGLHKTHFAIFCIKNITLGLLIIITIAEFAVLDEGISMPGWQDADVNVLFWVCVGAPLIADILYTLAAHALIFQTPKITIGGRTWWFHPAVALSFSLLFFVTWPFFTWFHSANVTFDEAPVDPDGAWRGLAFVGIAFEVILSLCYFLMLIFACMAVHRWRHAKKALVDKSDFIQLRNDDREVRPTPPPSYRSEMA